MGILIRECLLRNLRRKKKWSQARLARELKISQQMVSKLERLEKIMPTEMLFQVADIFECKVEDIYVVDIVRDRYEE